MDTLTRTMSSEELVKEQKLASLQQAPPPPRRRPASTVDTITTDDSLSIDPTTTTSDTNPTSTPIPSPKEEEPPPTKTLQGTRVINNTTYDFTMTAELNLSSPLDSILIIKCVSEYFDEYTLTTSAKVAQKRLIQLYSFDEDNYLKSTQYVIHHTLKILTINDENQLVVIDPPVTPVTNSTSTTTETAPDGTTTTTTTDHIVHGAKVRQARRRESRVEADTTHGVVTVNFSAGALGIELEDRPGKYGASIYDFTKDKEGETMAAEDSNLLERSMVVLRVGEKEAVGETFQDVLQMIRTSKRPMTVQFAHSYSKVLILADTHFGTRTPSVKKKKKKKKQKKDLSEKGKKLFSGPKKTLKGSRSINNIMYDFTCTAELDLEDPLNTILEVHCVSEYYDEYALMTTAGEIQERLIQLYPFDAENYKNSTKYTIHHSLKVYTIDLKGAKGEQLQICSPPDDLLKGAAVIQARARGMMQRKKDTQHGVVDVEFSSGSLGIHLEDRPGKYGASIHDFVKGGDNKDEMMAAESSGLLEIGMVVLRVNDQEAVGEKFQTVLTMLRNAIRPVEIQFGYLHSKVLKKADRHFGPRLPTSPLGTNDKKMSSTTIKPTKTLTGTRTIRGIKYDFEMVAKLNLDSPLDSLLTIDAVSEYYDEYW